MAVIGDTVRMVVRLDDGAVVQRLDYGPFGEVLNDTSPGFQPFGYAGGIYDADTGLVRFGARDYDPETGRWLTRDPIGFAAGDANLYAYVGGGPVNLVDPTGFFWQWMFGYAGFCAAVEFVDVVSSSNAAVEFAADERLLQRRPIDEIGES